MKRHLVDTSFGQIHCRVAGDGPPIALLHINQQSSALMIELVQALAPSLRAIAIDYPSHGGSDHITEQPTLEDYGRCVLEVMDALYQREFMVLGEATGAAVACELAAAHPARVSKIVLVNCPFFEASMSEDTLLDPFKSTYRPSDASGFPITRTIEFMLEQDPDHAPLRPSQSWMDRMNRAQMEAGRDRWQALTALRRYDLGATLERLRCPVLRLTGEHFYFRHMEPEFQKRVKHLHSEVLRDTRFCACWERANEIAARTIAFAQDTGT